MARRDQASMVPLAPISHVLDGDRLTVAYDHGITFDIRLPSQDRYGRLWAEITAKVGDNVANQARIDVLDQRQRVDFHAVAHARDGRIDWQSLLVPIIPLVDELLARAETADGMDHTPTTPSTMLDDPSVSFVSASPGASLDWTVPLPLPDPLPAVEPFEPRVLPEAFRPWLEDIAERMQCPLDYPAVSAMVGEAAVVGRRVWLRPKRRDDWLVVPNLWGGVIGRPGVLKSPALQEPLRPRWRLEYDAGRAHEEALTSWKAEDLITKERVRVASGKIRDALKKGQDATLLGGQLLASEPSAPVRQRYIINDSTVEKLGELLNENPNGLLVFRDELTGFLRTLDREGHEADRAFYLEAWNGTSRFTYDRTARETIEIEAARVSILGGIQPGPLTHYLRGALDGGVGDDGLIQRFQLLVWPDVSQEWRNVDRWPDSGAKRLAYEVFTRLSQMTSADVGAHCDEELGSIPYLRFDTDAQELFTEWRAELEHRLRQNEDHPAIEAHLAKYRSLVPSLALLLHLAEGHGNPVTVPALERVCAWTEYLESHARRVYSQGIAPGYVAARALARKLLKEELPREFTLRNVYRPQWTALTTPDEAMRAVEVLIDYRSLREVPAATGGAGGRPSPKYRVNPRIWEDAHAVA